jgi:hypothetical protein
VQLDLTDVQAALLREILDLAYRDLRYEISDTDNHAFKQSLREREEQLKLVLDRLGGPLPNQT